MNRRLSTSLSLLLIAIACGGGGGGGGGGSNAPTIHITSPADGRAFTDGNRDVTVTGTGTGMDTVALKLNGVATSAGSISSTSTTFAASLTLGDNANTIEAIATNARGSASSGVITVSYPFARFTTFQDAALVIGQADFTSNDGNQGGTPAANTIRAPYGDALVNGGRLYLSDSGNNRVLVFDSVPTTNGASADLALGEPDFATVTGAATATLWDGPETVTQGGGRLIVVEYGNSRVLILNSLPSASGPAADVAVGQPDLTSSSSGCAASSLDSPESAFTVDGKLLVADSSNNRVLIWNSIPTASGTAADLVLGQADFTHCGPNAGGSTASATTLDYPSDVWSDGTRLAVVDGSNHRVLVWNAFPTANGAPADLAVGQPDLTSNASATTQAGLNFPYYLASNGNQLFVADDNNHRVLAWDAFPTASGAAADVVLGQGDFTHGAANDDNQDGSSDTGPTARTLHYPSGVALWSGQLFVTDEENNRILVYDAQ